VSSTNPHAFSIPRAIAVNFDRPEDNVSSESDRAEDSAAYVAVLLCYRSAHHVAAKSLPPCPRLSVVQRCPIRRKARWQQATASALSASRTLALPRFVAGGFSYRQSSLSFFAERLDESQISDTSCLRGLLTGALCETLFILTLYCPLFLLLFALLLVTSLLRRMPWCATSASVCTTITASSRPCLVPRLRIGCVRRTKVGFLLFCFTLLTFAGYLNQRYHILPPNPVTLNFVPMGPARQDRRKPARTFRTGPAPASTGAKVAVATTVAVAATGTSSPQKSSTGKPAVPEGSSVVNSSVALYEDEEENEKDGDDEEYSDEEGAAAVGGGVLASFERQKQKEAVAVSKKSEEDGRQTFLQGLAQLQQKMETGEVPPLHEYEPEGETLLSRKRRERQELAENLAREETLQLHLLQANLFAQVMPSNVSSSNVGRYMPGSTVSRSPGLGEVSVTSVLHVACSPFF
jgi:hypothetical protein